MKRRKNISRVSIMKKILSGKKIKELKIFLLLFFRKVKLLEKETFEEWFVCRITFFSELEIEFGSFFWFFDKWVGYRQFWS